jgi:putative transposase
MPWRDVSPMDQRTRFIADYLYRTLTVTELCRLYEVSRKTGYKWIHRYELYGPAGLVERNRRPHSCPHRTATELVDAVLKVRDRHPSWGARKILGFLYKRDPDVPWPAESTVSSLLKRHGRVAKRRRRRQLGHPGRPDTPMKEPNAVWTADFKGEFKTRDGRYCYPLTIADGYSRFILGCQGMASTAHVGAKAVFRRVFAEYGLPQIIRTDNGVPFATTALARLSRLSVWWVRLGIYPELIELGHPEQNGRHERMHRTLKAETTRPPAGNRAAQQKRFNRFLAEFNEVRPHEAIGQQTPASIYQPSERSMPSKIPPIEYPAHFEVRLVSTNGGMRWNSKRVPVSHVLGGEYVGLEEIDDGIWNVYFGPLELGRLDERELRIEDALGRKRRRKV